MKRVNFDILDENHDVTAYERHYTSSLLSTCQRRNSSPAIPHHGLSHDHVVRHPHITGGTPPSNCVTSIHNRRGGAGILMISLLREREYWTFWGQNLTVDLRRIYLTIRDLTS